jgi:hypothetical protein
MRFFFIAFFFLWFAEIHGQEKNVSQSLGVDYSYGSILRHSAELPSISSNRINGFTLNYSRILTSENKMAAMFLFSANNLWIVLF